MAEYHWNLPLEPRRGEQVFLYCIGAQNQTRHLAAISYNGNFSAAGKSSYTVHESALPESLSVNGTIVLPAGKYNWIYDGPQRLEEKELKAAIRDPDQWKGTSTASGQSFLWLTTGVATGLAVLALEWL
jgi:hypothetical protein